MTITSRQSAVITMVSSTKRRKATAIRRRYSMPSRNCSMTLTMEASKAISKAYEQLLSIARKTDTPMYGGKTSEDLLGECAITMVNRWKGDFEYETIYADFERMFKEKCFFSFKKKVGRKNTFIEFIPDYPKNL
jgi:hypothetical protein